MSFNIIRFISASALVLFFLFLREKKIWVEKSDWGRILLLGIFGHTCYQLLFIYGINKTTASNASLIMASVPILIGIMSSLSGYEKVRPFAWIGIFLSFFGIFLIIRADVNGFNFTSAHFKGNILILLSAISWAIYTVVAKPMLKKYSPLKLTAVSMAIGTLLLIPFSLNELKKQDWQSISFPAWMGLIYSSILAIALGYTLWYIGVEKVGTTRTAIYSNLTPVLAAFFAWQILAELITIYHLIGAAVIFTGIYLTRFNAGKKRMKELK